MTTKAIVKKEVGKLRPMEPWEEEAAAQARTERAQETLGVPRITTRGGALKVDGKPVQGGKLKLAIVDYVFEKRFTIGKFDPNDLRPPDCYAQARPNPGEQSGDTEGRMVAHAQAPGKQNLQADGTSPCRGCKHNAFGTAEVGRGKACKDYRKLLVMSPRIKDGVPEVDEDAVQKAVLYQIDISPAALKDFGLFYSGLRGVTRTGNIREAIVEASVESLDSGGHKTVFQFVDAVPSAGFKAILDLAKSKSDLLMQPWPVREREKPEDKAPLKGQAKRR